jgi:hypothetical protein
VKLFFCLRQLTRSSFVHILPVPTNMVRRLPSAKLKNKSYFSPFSHFAHCKTKVASATLRPPPPRLVLEDMSGDEESRPVSLILFDCSEDELDAPDEDNTWPSPSRRMMQPRPSIIRPWSTPNLPGHRHIVSRVLSARDSSRYSKNYKFSQRENTLCSEIHEIHYKTSC